MIEVKNVTFRYDTDTEGISNARAALEDVSLSVGEGEFLAVVGHNGSGKSTLAKLLNGLLLPSEGTVTVDDLSTADEENLIDIRRRVGLVFQNPDNQLVTTVVEEDVAFGPENLGIPPKEIRERVDRALQEVGMTDYALKASHALSGGQKQRVAIAGMLAVQPKTLVLDEATAMLDPAGRADILSIVSRLHREQGMTVIMITQYMEEVVGCDRVVVMDGGRVLLEGTPRQVFAEAEKLRACGLDVPEAVRIAETLRAEGLPLEGDPITLEELTEALCRLS